ncbi:MAG: UDP-N-acetylglucosamine 2-epimerase (non-hydrolyzing) [Clostridia bacterium]|nr:UDP-N-acetylglucosamine 2-epimerase (non-hydrolyzing) [Clostridia bacterium]MBN2883734.1 UDP-N-acetylglucosamine 2-epimerase (non-hydrolyzing) [Clostridia bacterium]
MKKNKVLIVYGTRPDAIKMAPVVIEFKKDSAIETVVCTTAQHRETIDMVNDIFGIKPDFDLDIMKQSQTLEYITSSIMEKFSKVLDTEKPDMVLVHGDTATCLICSLASFYKKIPVGHVEAGLRTHDIYSPFPEEMNRKLVGNIASLHFCPTESNRTNLLKENVPDSCIFVTGNTAIDALNTTVGTDYEFNCSELNAIDYNDKRVILLTAHRRENLGAPLVDICEAVLDITEKFKDVVFVYPVHPNPAVQNTVRPILFGKNRIILTDMLDVRDLHNLMKRAYMVMTDSGGLQEEAPALGKPVLVLRKETERPEAVEMGTVKLSGICKENIIADASELLSGKDLYMKMATAVNPYGDGHASERIHAAVLEYFSRST